MEKHEGEGKGDGHQHGQKPRIPEPVLIVKWFAGWTVNWGHGFNPHKDRHLCWEFLHQMRPWSTHL